VEPLAARLGVSKGSFYWHFRDRADLVAAALERYREVSTTQLIAHNEALGGSAATRLCRIFELVVNAAARHPGDIALLTGSAPAYAVVREELATARIAYLRGLLVEAGVPAADAQPRATLAFAAYLGLAQLAAGSPAALGRRRKALPMIMADLLAGAGARRRLPPG